MSTIFTGGVPTRQNKLLEEFEAPLGDVFSAVAEEAWLRSLSPSIANWITLDNSGTGRISEGQQRPGPIEPLREPTEQRIAAEDARERVQAHGLKLSIPEDGIPESALAELIERARAERIRNDVINRSPEGWHIALAKVGVALGTSLLDPLNVASVFVPVIGPARYSSMLARQSSALGRAGVRARVGAIEGTVGQALVEPIVYGSAQAEQADYDFTDSFIAIAFGTVLGGGLHTGAGAIGDAFRKGTIPKPDGATAQRIANLPVEARVAVQKVALAQAVQGKSINVENLVRLAEAQSATRPKTIGEARAQALDELSPIIRAALLPDTGNKLSRKELINLRSEKFDVERKLEAEDSSFQQTVKRIQKEKRATRKEAETAARKEIKANRARLSDVLTRVDDQLSRHAKAVESEAVLARLESQKIIPADFVERVEARAQQIANERPSNNFPASVKKEIADAFAAVKAQARADGTIQSSVANPQAADELVARVRERTDELDADAAKADLDDALLELNDLSKALGADTERAFTAFDEIIEQADTLDKAMHAAVSCQLRRA